MVSNLIRTLHEVAERVEAAAEIFRSAADCGQALDDRDEAQAECETLRRERDAAREAFHKEYESAKCLIAERNEASEARDSALAKWDQARAALMECWEAFSGESYHPEDPRHKALMAADAALAAYTPTEALGIEEREQEELRNWLWQRDTHKIPDSSVIVGPGSPLIVGALTKLARAALAADTLRESELGTALHVIQQLREAHDCPFCEGRQGLKCGRHDSTQHKADVYLRRFATPTPQEGTGDAGPARIPRTKEDDEALRKSVMAMGGPGGTGEPTVRELIGQGRDARGNVIDSRMVGQEVHATKLPAVSKRGTGESE